MSLATIVLLVLVLAFFGVLPAWPYSRRWGYGPTGAMAAILVSVFALLIVGRL